jgi:hypothetical protein
MRRHHRAVINDDEQRGHAKREPRSIPRNRDAS